MASKQSKKVKAKELLQKSIDSIPKLEQQSADSDQFTKWRRDTEVAIEHIFSADSRHIGDFNAISYWPMPTLFTTARPGRPAPRQKDPRPDYLRGLGEARVVLQSMIDEIETHWEDDEATAGAAPVDRTPGEIIELICNRFHTVTRQLKKRGRGKPAVEIADEYDVQYLMRALLYLFFEDVRPEEWTPSYAGKSARVDFLLKVEKTVLEIKHARPTLTEKELGDELIIDIRRYQATHPDCQSLYCFVYDPEGYIDNPRGMENDLSKVTEGMQVKVIIAPKSH